MTKATYKAILKPKRLFPLIILPLLLLQQYHSEAYAEGVALKINPSVIQIKTKAPSDVRAPFIIENQSDQSIKLKIGYKLFDPAKSQEGRVIFSEDTSPNVGIFDHIQVTDSTNTAINSLDLGPRQQKQLQLRVLFQDNYPSEDHYFSLVFLHDVTSQTDQNSTIRDRKDQHTITTIQGGIAANVLLAVGAPEMAQGYIEEFSSPLYLQSGPVPFSLKIKNTGTHYINPTGSIRITNLFGQTVGKVEIPATTILAGTTRSLLDKGQLAKAVHPGSDSKVIWPEKFILGLYNAEIDISMAAGGPTYNQTIRFFAFPIHLLFVALIVIGLGVITYVKVKRKLS